MTSRGVDNYTLMAYFDLPEDPDVSRSQKAWKQLLQVHPVLRSQIIQDSPGMCSRCLSERS